ncbi:MAG TPA: adenylate/guanylate cyclase domain-containing protein [Bacteroidales bacterium]|nr:adenylate/guanylate cyclase domain-containing protein [Bacteroidales bacterium]
MAPIKLILFFIFLQFGFVFSQTIELGVPYCQNITPTEIGYGGAMYSIAQDKQGTMFFGNFNGLLYYNGSEWHIQTWNGKPIMYQGVNNTIYVGGFNTIAELVIDEYNRYTFVSLVDSTADFGQIDKIVQYQNRIYFVANKSLYYISNNQPKKLLSDSKFLSVFTDRNKMFISTSDGLYEFKDEKAETTNISDFFRNNEIIELFRYANVLIARTYDSFYKIKSDNSIEKFITDIDAEVLQYEYSTAQKLSNNILCVATKKNGIYFINENGKLVNYLNTDNGLYDNSIYDLFVDKANNLWAGFSNGVCRIEIPSAFTYFNRSYELHGKVTSIIRHNKYMYIGTESGLYKLVKGESKVSTFQKIFKTSTQCNVMISLKESLLVGTKQGLYEIVGDVPQLLFQGNIIAIKIHKTSQLLWVATKTHVYILKKNGKSISLVQAIGPFNSEINSIAIENDTVTWVGTYYEGVFQIKQRNGFFDIQKFSSKSGLPKFSQWIEVYETSSGILFSTAVGLYRFDSGIGMFYKDSKITIPLEYVEARVSPIIEDADKNLWVAFKSHGIYENQIAVAWNSGNQDRYTLIVNQFNKLSKFICSTIYPDMNSVVWLGGFDGLVRMDFKELFTKKNNEKTRIHSIYIANDSLLLHNWIQNNKVVFEYKYNSIRFEFTTPIFENPEKILHTYILEGYTKDWSRPKHISHKEFENLPAGSYVFRVKAIDIYGNESPESVFSFRIKQHPLKSWWAFLLYIILFAAVVVLIFRWRSYLFLQEKTKLSKIIRQRTEDLLIEKEKTDTILRNILPEQTARELKEKGRATSMRFEMATILFADIQGFTKIAEQMPPDTLIDELDKFFLEFDTIVEHHNIEKIKTIGDAYMCAGGIPEKNRTNPIEVVVAALEMQYRVRVLQENLGENLQNYWGLRIGIHTGPVIAGVVGSKKYSYDIWGDSVNIASRMESSGEVGKVNISETTFMLIQDFFDCDYRGKMPVKYKGEIDMYFVKGFKVQFSDNHLRVLPNKSFGHKLALLKFEDLHEIMLERFEKELPKDLYYHNLKHTIDVIVQVEIIGHEEGINDEDMLLLKTAALFHDAGFLIGYNDHEELGIQMTRMILPKYNYTEEQIQTICEIITATKLPHNPKNKLEEIMCDADLDYLGRNDYLSVSRDLYKELIEHNVIKKSEMEWNVMQIKFLQHHRFFTASSRNRRNANKNKQIQHLQEQTRSFKI